MVERTFAIADTVDASGARGRSNVLIRVDVYVWTYRLELNRSRQFVDVRTHTNTRDGVLARIHAGISRAIRTRSIRTIENWNKLLKWWGVVWMRKLITPKADGCRRHFNGTRSRVFVCVCMCVHVHVHGDVHVRVRVQSDWCPQHDDNATRRCSGSNDCNSGVGARWRWRRGLITDTCDRGMHKRLLDGRKRTQTQTHTKTMDGKAKEFERTKDACSY